MLWSGVLRGAQRHGRRPSRIAYVMAVWQIRYIELHPIENHLALHGRRAA
jgi:hypothetical protein